jgi:hypothetical protein
LNAFALAELFPNDIEKQTILEVQLKAEIRAKRHYQRRRRDLSNFIKARLKASVGKTASSGQTG